MDSKRHLFPCLSTEMKTISSGECVLTARKRNESLGQGNIFAPVCHSVHGGREYLGRYILPEQVHPPRQVHPLGRYTPNRYTPRQVHPLGMYTPQAGTPPWAGSPPTGTPPGRYTPQQIHPLGRYIPPGRYTPIPPHPRVNERAVRILLECILVIRCFVT